MNDDQLVAAIAVAVAGKAVDGLAEGGKAAFGALVRLVRRMCDRSKPAREALTAAEEQPEDEARVRTLRSVLAEMIAADPELGAELRDRWRAMGVNLPGRNGGIINQVSGTISGNVVQARDVHGGISFGGGRG